MEQEFVLLFLGGSLQVPSHWGTKEKSGSSLGWRRGNSRHNPGMPLRPCLKTSWRARAKLSAVTLVIPAKRGASRNPGRIPALGRMTNRRTPGMGSRAALPSELFRHALSVRSMTF